MSLHSAARPAARLSTACVAALALLACTKPDKATGPDGGGGPQASRGSIRFVVRTVGQELDADGYDVEIEGVGVRRVASDGYTTVDGVAAGNVALVVRGVAANCALFGAAQRSASVATRQTSDVRLTVACQSSTAYGFGSVNLSTLNLSTLGYIRGVPQAEAAKAAERASRNAYRGLALSYAMEQLNSPAWSGSSRSSYGGLDAATQRDIAWGYGSQQVFGFEDYRFFRNAAPAAPGARRSAGTARAPELATVAGYDTTFKQYFVFSRYADHSRRVVLYADSTYATPTGMIAIDAPLWAGGQGVFPMITRSVLDFTVDGVRTQAVVATLLTDATGRNGRQVMRMESGTGELRYYDLAVQNDALASYVRLQNAVGAIEMRTAQNAEGYATQVQASTGEGGTLITRADGSGYYQLQYLGAVFFYALWDAQGQGYYQIAGGAPTAFSDVRTLFGG